MNKREKIIILVVGIVIASLYLEKLKITPMEEFNISSGFGVDIKKNLNGTVEYSIPFSMYEYKKQEKGSAASITGEESTEISSRVVVGKAKNIIETREERQLKSDKSSLVGVQRVILLSEEKSRYGISDIIGIQFANPKINDRGIVAVCKGTAEELLAFKVEGYSSAADYVEGMIRHATNYNFLSSEYTLLNMYIKLDSEGENLVLPYIEIKDKNIIFTGMSVFQGKKMVLLLPMEEGKVMNILREKKGKGILSLQESSDQYINYDTMVKRKVKCSKRDEKYEFNIELEFQGDIISNTAYKDMNEDNIKEFESLMEQKIEKVCKGFVEKMKTVYKTDCLDLGMYGAAKYGRETGVDWNKEVCNADITVKVKVKIDKIGIGQY